jgi:hypothetical protein
MHETIDDGTAAVEAKLRNNSSYWPAEALHYSALSRGRTTRVWQGVQPRVALHGHMHVADDRIYDDGRRVISMGCDHQVGNLGVLDLRDLSWAWLTGSETPRARRDRNWERKFRTVQDDEEDTRQ